MTFKYLKEKKGVEKLKQDIVVLLRGNFDPFFDSRLKIYGKGELEVKCDAISDIIAELCWGKVKEILQSHDRKMLEWCLKETDKIISPTSSSDMAIEQIRQTINQKLQKLKGDKMTVKYISKFKERIRSSAKTLDELMAFASLNDVTIFKFNDEFWRLEREDLPLPPEPKETNK